MTGAHLGADSWPSTDIRSRIVGIFNICFNLETDSDTGASPVINGTIVRGKGDGTSAALSSVASENVLVCTKRSRHNLYACTRKQGNATAIQVGPVVQHM